MSEQLMTQEELAFRWKISEATLERDRSLKQGCRYLKIGGLIRYKMQDVLEYEDACTHEPKAAKLKEKNTRQDGDCKHCVNGCPACDARRQSNVLP